MIQKVFPFLVIIPIFILFSCEQKVKKSIEEVEKENISNVISDDFSNYKNALKKELIEAQIHPDKSIKSLLWEKQTKEFGSQFIQVEGYLDEEGYLVKIIEYFTEGNYQPHGQRTYFLENNKIIFYEETIDTWKDSISTQYIEKRTVYENDIPALSQMRQADLYDDIFEEPWKEIPTEFPTLERVNNILSGTNEFQTHFISVVKGEQLFLLLGEPKPQTEERYTTAVLVPEMNPFVEDLLSNLDNYKFRAVEIQFKVIGGDNEPEFSVLTDIRWKD